MSAIVQLRVQDGKEWVTKRVQLLGGNVVPDADDGFIRYDFQPLMREIVAESRVFARLHKQIMFALSSKYSLALYEMIQKRGNMTRTYEEMTIDEFRSFLGVPAGKLNTWINFKNFAIRPAVSEVSDLSDFKVTVDPVKGKGKQFTGVRLSWERKALPELRAVERELNASKVGRKARLAEKVGAMEFGLPLPLRLRLRLRFRPPSCCGRILSTRCASCARVTMSMRWKTNGGHGRRKSPRRAMPTALSLPSARVTRSVTRSEFTN